MDKQRVIERLRKGKRKRGIMKEREKGGREWKMRRESERERERRMRGQRKIGKRRENERDWRKIGVKRKVK